MGNFNEHIKTQEDIKRAINKQIALKWNRPIGFKITKSLKENKNKRKFKTQIIDLKEYLKPNKDREDKNLEDFKTHIIVDDTDIVFKLNIWQRFKRMFKSKPYIFVIEDR